MPVAATLPQGVAASIGRTIMRHAYLETLRAKILYQLLALSPKQGRIVIRLPQTSKYASTVRDLLQYHKVFLTDYNYSQLSRVLDKSDAARNILAHSIFLRNKETRQLHIQIVRGSWELEHDVMSVSRALQPESRLVNRAFLQEQRAAVEKGIRAIIEFGGTVERGLNQANEKRRQHPDFNRRRVPTVSP